MKDWKINKTSASVAFVYQAEILMQDLSLEEQIKLQLEIDLIKGGQKNLTEWISVSKFLNGPIV